MLAQAQRPFSLIRAALSGCGRAENKFLSLNSALLMCLWLWFGAPLAARAEDAPKVPKPARIVPREQWGSAPQPIPDQRKHTPKFITLHHAGVDYKPGTDPAKFVKNMQSWGQREKHWPDLAYHFLIAPDGRIFEARPLDYEPESNTRYPLQGHLGVEMMGNFETQRPSEQQLKSCVALVAWLCQEQRIDPSQIGGHKDRAVGQTSCPGKDFYRYLKSGEFVGWVKDTLAGKTPDVKSGPPLEGGPAVLVESGSPATTSAVSRDNTPGREKRR